MATRNSFTAALAEINGATPDPVQVVQSGDTFNWGGVIGLGLFPLVWAAVWLSLPFRLAHLDELPTWVIVICAGIQNTTLAMLTVVGLLFAVLNRGALYRHQLKRLQEGERFILYLRGFRRDTDRQDIGGRSPLEAMIVQKFGKITPFVAIDNPSAPNFSAGAVRVQASDNAWRKAVEVFSRSAAAVIVDCRDDTPGLEEEVKAHTDRESGRSHHVLFLMREHTGRSPAHSINLERLGVSAVEFKLSEAKPDWTPICYTFDGRTVTVHRGRKIVKQKDYLHRIERFLREAT